ncbi:MAG: urease accessory protein UreE [Porticoccaceae bacterium]|jgi:urease accessory protein|nr:urease accessory protein UreE [Porticoccaceae bacterium]MEA3299600.1 urease accessory protein UreE [Pseudomonadota bacterium]HLS97488.1 urease accessory protein UreE [Porticoccaceae bacterium]
MLIVTQFAPPAEHADRAAITVELPYDLRKKSRLRAVSRCGRELGFQLERGAELRDGQRLLADSGEVVVIVASAEALSSVSGDSPLALLRAAYHLGNRHVPLQVTEHWLRYQHDHVLDDMVRGLGLAVTLVSAPFQPESGAYGRHGGGHHHGGGDHPQGHGFVLAAGHHHDH